MELKNFGEKFAGQPDLCESRLIYSQAKCTQSVPRPSGRPCVVAVVLTTLTRNGEAFSWFEWSSIRRVSNRKYVCLEEGELEYYL